MTQATSRKLSQAKVNTFRVECIKSVNPHGDREYFSKGRQYIILRVDNRTKDIMVLNNYGTQHSLGAKESGFFKQHFRLIDFHQ